MRQFIDIVESTGQFTLYHGTSLWGFLLILGTNEFQASSAGDYGDFTTPGVSFTTDPDIAYKFARDAAYRALPTLQEMCGESFRGKTTVIIHLDGAALERDHGYEIDGLDDEQKAELEHRVLRDIPEAINYMVGYQLLDSVYDSELFDGLEQCAERGDDPYLKRDARTALEGSRRMSQVRRIH